MTTKKDLTTAFQHLVATDDSNWEADGSPSVTIIQALLGDDNITLAAIDAATGGARRPVQSATKETGGAPAAPAADAGADKPDEPTVAPVQTHAEREAALVAAAREALAKVVTEISALENQRADITQSIQMLIGEKDKQSRIIEQYGPRVSFAEGVKAIQEQTTARLATLKENSILAATALKASGTVVHPSILDASLANRRRTPEQAANYAKFVHQGSKRISEGTGI